jgi:hypothetical protein
MGYFFASVSIEKKDSSTDVDEFLGVDQGVDEVINAAET